VGIHRDSRFTEGSVEYYVGSLSPHAWQPF
jgi:hypothetical protein